ncbi:MAG: hypothetical protein WCS01_11070 [bacterium]
MGSLIEILVDFVAQIWTTDSDLRDSSVLGESREDRKDRKMVGWICGSTIVLVFVAGLIGWWWIEHK